MLAYYAGYWDTWNAYHKVTFDIAKKLIYINEGVTFLNVKVDLYSSMKEWMLFTETNNKQRLPGISSVGGDFISDTEQLGDTYFLEEGWKIKPWLGHTSITIEGNLYSRDGLRPIIPDDNNVDAVSLKVSALTSTIIVDTSVDNDTDAPVWDSLEGISNAYQNGSSINIAWGRATDANPVSYNVYISKFDTNLFSPTNLFNTLDGYFYTIRGIENEVLQDGVEYFIGVRAIDILGNETDNANFTSIIYTTATTVAEVDIHNALDNYTNKDQWQADVSNLSADVNVVQVNGVAVTSIDDFKTDATSIVAELMNTDVHTYSVSNSIGEIFHRITGIERKVYVDTEVLVNGDGSQANPFNSFNDAKDYAELIGVYVISLHGEVTIPSNFKNFTVEGIGVPVINTNNQDINNSKFYQCKVSGTYTGAIIVQDSVILPNTTTNGFFEKCVIMGAISTPDTSQTLIANCISGEGVPTVDMSTGGSSHIRVANHSGDLKFINMDNAGDYAFIEMSQGKAHFDTSDVLGSALLRGNTLIEGTTGGTNLIDETFSRPTVVADVWTHNSRSLTEFTPVLDAITALNNLSLLDIEGSTVLAREATLNSIAVSIAAIPTTDSVADLTPVLTAVSSLNDVTPAQVRAAFNEAEFKDKNTELEVHTWLDSYINKDDWKVPASTIDNAIWSKVV